MQINSIIRSGANLVFEEVRGAFRSVVDGRVEGKVIEAEEEGLARAASAMLEAKVKRETMQYVLAKHWHTTVDDVEAVIRGVEREAKDEKKSPK